MLKNLYRFLSPRFQNLFLDYKVTFKPRYGHGKPPHPQLFDIIEKNKNIYAKYLEAALSLKEYFWKIKNSIHEKDDIQPCWNNKFLPGLDIIGLYTMLCEHKPKRYVEIGSGNSTKIANRVKADHNLDFQIISIDPYPRVEIDNLVQKMVRENFEDSTYDIVGQLEENDILFVDNSHRILPNSDAMVFFLEVLPRLKKGVIVHVHDIYLPYDYPQFMCDRYYSEQYGLAIYLLANPIRYQTILPNYFISEDKELSALISPIWNNENMKNVEIHGGSYWLKII